MDKTNVMRILKQHKIKYQSYYYGDTSVVSGVEVATVLNQDFRRVFKTLVTVSNSKKYYVFMIPVDKELDLKKLLKVFPVSLFLCYLPKSYFLLQDMFMEVVLQLV